MAPVFERMSSQPDRIGLAVVSTREAAIEPEERDLLDVVVVTGDAGDSGNRRYRRACHCNRKNKSSSSSSAEALVAVAVAVAVEAVAVA